MFKKIVVIFLIFTGLISHVYADERRFIGIWHKGTGSNIITRPVELSAFLARGSELADKGLRLIDVETDRHNGKRFYTGVWVSGSGSNMFAGPMNVRKFAAQRKSFREKGMRLIDFEVFRSNGRQRFLGVWRSGTGSETLTRPLTLSQFIKRGEKLVSEGKRLIDVEVVQRGNTVKYIGLYRTGTGGNLFTSPRSHKQFIKTRDEMLEKGMQLEDMEMFRKGDQFQYVGVWKSGSGESRRSRSRNYSQFSKAGENFTKNKGLRLADVEIFMKNKEQAQTSTRASQSSAENVSFPPLPQYIEFSGGPRVIVDFGIIIDGKPRITIPVDFLPVLPIVDDKPVFPDNFCGLRVIRASSFFWHDQQNKVVYQTPYNSSENVVDLGSNVFLGGIDFTGPVGICSNTNDSWFFPQPLTSTGKNPLPGLKLVIELSQGSRIEFLNYTIQPGEGLNPLELFSDDVFEKLEKIAKAFELDTSIDNGYCGIDEYVKEVCKESKAKCPVSDEFDSPC